MLKLYTSLHFIAKFVMHSMTVLSLHAALYALIFMASWKANIPVVQTRTEHMLQHAMHGEKTTQVYLYSTF